MYIAVGSLSVYGTMIRGCGVVNTIYQVVNSTYGLTLISFDWCPCSIRFVEPLHVQGS